jgi:TPR repeat protein
MSYLGFGGKAIAGGVDVDMLLPADAACHHRVLHPSTPEQVLGNDAAVHGGLNSHCGDLFRSKLVPLWENAQVPKAAVETAGSAAGPPTYAFWPAWDDMLHQKMWIDWIRRAYDGGQRVMVALADHDDLTARSFSGPHDGPNDDRGSADLQTDWMKKLVERHPDFLEIALTAADVRRIVGNVPPKMAVILGTEIDSLGNLNSEPAVMACEDLREQCAAHAKSRVLEEIAHLYEKGVRYVFPIHVVDNVFGGTAVYTGIFDLANLFTYGRTWELECASPSEGIGYDGSFGVSGGAELALRGYVLAKMLRGFHIPPPPRCTPKAGVRNKRGLTKLGVFALHEMMRRGMLIDVDHMSEHATDGALDLAEAVPGGGYPLMSGHNALRGTVPHVGAEASEMNRTRLQLERVARLHGMFGLGNAGIDAHAWIADYGEVAQILPEPGAVSFGTDLDGMVVGSPPSPMARVHYGAAMPMSCAPAGTPCWDYNTAGVAHYGMLRDFLEDARTAPWGASLVNERLFAGAEYFQQTWARAERQAASVSSEGASPASASSAPACASACCEACSVCERRGPEGGTCAACKGCQTACVCPSPPRSASASSAGPASVDVGALTNACNSGDARACEAAGEAYGSGNGVAEDSNEALRFYRQACQLKRARSCLDLGRMFDEGDGVAVDDRDAAALFRRACDLGEPDGCHRLAGLLLEGSGVKTDAKRAMDFERRACDVGFRPACMALAEMHATGNGGPKDPGAAAKVVERMCQQGDREACLGGEGGRP